ncbi:MAG: methylmalonyl-CoA mutase, partial [Candidatus Rokubacteria bacterium]|nr:methylmalonyl-CoA mutase [Candidatus Rokubacteria bacterium]
ARPEIGKVGVSLSNLAEMEILFGGIDLTRISTSFTINGTAAIILAMYIACADKQGAPREELTGTIQNDILKEYVARGTWIFPTEPSMRMIADTIEYASRELPRFNPISIAGAHFKDAGGTAVQEAAFTLADAIAYVERVLGRGLAIDAFAPRLSFYFYTHSDLFEEVAKYRAMRRLWARLMRDRFGAQDPRSWHFRFGVVCGGSTLTRQEPLNNVVRVAYQALASVLGGVQTIFTCAWDEAIAIPTEASALLALRTQQILAHETNVPAVVDPLGGSYFLEDLTTRMEAAVAEEIARIERDGGMVAAIQAGRIQQEIADSAFRWQQAVEVGDRRIVGVNWDRTEEAPVGEFFREDPYTVSHQLARLARTKAGRDPRRVEKALDGLEEAALQDEPLMSHFLEAAAARVTVGEMVARLRRVFGEFREPLVF